jgi:hypothetical protein
MKTEAALEELMELCRIQAAVEDATGNHEEAERLRKRRDKASKLLADRKRLTRTEAEQVRRDALSELFLGDRC